MRIVSFNVQNLRLRHPAGRARLDGARDHDIPQDATPAARALDLADRRLTAQVLARADADVICLQEVFDRATLDFFHDHLLARTTAAPWPYRICLPGNDGGGRDLAILSRRPLGAVASHADLRPADLALEGDPGAYPDKPVFCRDCLQVTVSGLTLFLCHFKAPGDAPMVFSQRRLEALAVRALIERHLARGGGTHWLVLGDLNEPAEVPRGLQAIAPLLPPFSVDLLERLPEAERWTWASPDGNLSGRPDAMLAAPALAARFPAAIPRVLREGLGAEVFGHAGPDLRLPGVGTHRPHASDHCALLLDLPGL